MTDYRPITPAECYELARKDWMPAAAADAFVRCARTLEELQPEGWTYLTAEERRIAQDAVNRQMSKMVESIFTADRAPGKS